MLGQDGRSACPTNATTAYDHEALHPHVIQLVADEKVRMAWEDSNETI